MAVLVICKNEEDPIKNEDTRVVTTFYIDFSDAEGQLTRIWPKIKFIPSLMVVLVTCKNENHKKMKALEWSQQFSHYKFMVIFQDAQGQLTPQSVVQSGQIVNSFELLWLSLLTQCELSVAMETRVLIRSFPKT